MKKTSKTNVSKKGDSTQTPTREKKATRALMFRETCKAFAESGGLVFSLLYRRFETQASHVGTTIDSSFYRFWNLELNNNYDDLGESQDLN